MADALSRPQVDAINAKITNEDIAEAQKTDSETAELRTNGYRDQVFNELLTETGNSIFCSFFNGVNRPIVPKNLHLAVFHQIHGIAHPGAKATTRMLRSRFYWPKMTTDIQKWQ